MPHIQFFKKADAPNKKDIDDPNYYAFSAGQNPEAQKFHEEYLKDINQDTILDLIPGLKI